MNKPKVFGIVVVALAFVGTSIAFSNCGQSRYQGPNTAPPVVVDDESFLNGDPVQVGGNVSNISAQGDNLVGDGFVCIPSFTDQPQVRVNRKYFNGATSVTDRIGSQLYPANIAYTGETSNCEGGSPYAFNLNVPLSTFETSGLAIGDANVSDQVFYVEVLIPGNVLNGGEDIYVPLPGSVYIPSGLSTGYHAIQDQPNTVRYVWYNDIGLLIDDDPSTIAEVYFCTVTETEIVTTQYQTSIGLFENITTITETDCPDFIVVNPTDNGGNVLPCVEGDNVATHYAYNDVTYIGINCRYCENEDNTRDPFRQYVELTQAGYEELTSRPKFPGLPCNGNIPGDPGDDNIGKHVMYDGRTYIEINNRYCANDEGFVDPNVEYMVLDQAAYEAMIAKPDFEGAPCNVLVEPPPAGGGDSIAYLSYDGRQYIRINGSYCVNDADIVDPTHTYDPLSENDYNILLGLPSFEGLPCNDPTWAGAGGGGGEGTAYLSYNGRQYIRINGSYCVNDVDIVDTTHTYDPIGEADYNILVGLSSFEGLPCNDPSWANAGGGDPVPQSLADVDDGQYAANNNATVLKKVDDTTACRVTTGIAGVKYGDADPAALAAVNLLMAAWDNQLVCSQP